MKPIAIDLDDLALARNQFGSEFLHVLDLRNGRIHMVEEFGGDLTDCPETDNDAAWEDDGDDEEAESDEEIDDSDDDDPGFDPAPSPEDVPTARDVHMHPEVFLLIEPRESHIAFRDMEEFVDSLPEGEPRRALARSLRLPSPFRAFKDTLYDFPNERDEWFAFSEERQRQDAITWLRAHKVPCAS
jgi:hypothetical protein